QHLREAFAAFAGAFWAGDGDGPNPYAGFLGWADRLVVTPDSVNMLSEACATGKPVLTYVHEPVRGKLAAFHAALREAGQLHDLGADTGTAPPPLRETTRVAGLARARWHRR